MTYQEPAHEPDGIVALAAPVKPRSKPKRWAGIGASVLAMAVAVTGVMMPPDLIQAAQASKYDANASKQT